MKYENLEFGWRKLARKALKEKAEKISKEILLDKINTEIQTAMVARDNLEGIDIEAKKTLDTIEGYIAGLLKAEKIIKGDKDG